MTAPDPIAERQVQYLADQLARMEAQMIDPREFGRLEAEVQSLQEEVKAMRQDIRELIELANRSKGGFWGGMAVASSAGAAVAWFVDKVLLR